MLEQIEKIKSSFRDPSGYMFQQDGELFRHINPSYFADYDHLMQSGLYEKLVQKKFLIPHEEVSKSQNGVTIKPKKVNFISYPYEWCFSQLKDAALLTLNIMEIALEHGMILKDASNYNVQFHHGSPIFIDTLSFERVEEGRSWQAYRQFCQHFLAPLMLMSYRDIRLNQLLKVYIDGIPLDLASSLLPMRSRFNLSSAFHIHLHAKLQKKYQDDTKSTSTKTKGFTLLTLKRFVQGLISATENLSWKVQKDSEWYDYYIDNNNYSVNSLSQKEQIIDAWLELLKPQTVWDLGANTGRFSVIASKHSNNVIAFDIDLSCVESFYLHLKKQTSNIIPLVLDLTNPSPSIGWGHEERASLMERGPVDAILALGLIHHIAIVNNVPLSHVAKFFSQICNTLIIEFVPKEDSQVIKLLSTREDIFAEYDLNHFEAHFSTYFDIQQKQKIDNSERTLYLLTRSS